MTSRERVIDSDYKNQPESSDKAVDDSITPKSWDGGMPQLLKMGSATAE